MHASVISRFDSETGECEDEVEVELGFDIIGCEFAELGGSIGSDLVSGSITELNMSPDCASISQLEFPSRKALHVGHSLRSEWKA